MHGIQPRSFFVVGLDALDIEVDEFAAREPLRCERGVNILNGRFEKMKTLSGRADGVPTWSLVTVFARSDSGFTIIY